MEMLLDKEYLTYSPPPLGCVLSLPGLPGGGAKTHDRSPYGNHGAVTGAAWVRLPNGLWCLSFDGQDDYVNCGNHPSLQLDEFTLLLWMCPMAYTYYNTWFKKGDWAQPSSASGAIYPTTHKLRFDVYDSVGDRTNHESNATIDLDEWVLVTVTYDGDKIRMYINSRLDLTGNSMVLGTLSALDMLIGAVSTGGGNNFQGYMGLVRIYNRAINLLAIQNHINRKKHLFGVW